MSEIKTKTKDYEIPHMEKECDTDDFLDIETDFDYSPEDVHKLSTKELLKYFDIIKPSITDEELKKKPRFHNVYGNKEVKEELNKRLEWFNNIDEYTNKKIIISNGLILNGAPGCGKTLMLKEIIRTSKYYVLVYKGDNFDFAKVIKNIKLLNKIHFDENGKWIEDKVESKNKQKYILIFDELDRTLGLGAAQNIEALKVFLDGVFDTKNMLFIGACNHFKDDEALTRDGRLDKIFTVQYPAGEDAFKYFKDLFKASNVSLPKDLNEDDYINLLTECPYSTVKFIVNDCLLRNGFENITIENIDDSIFNGLHKVVTRNKERQYYVAIHEASHALITYINKEYFDLTRVNYAYFGGINVAKVEDEKRSLHKKIIAEIDLSLAGVIGEQIILKSSNVGCESDLEEASNLASSLIKSYGYKDLDSDFAMKTRYKRNKKICDKYDKRARKIIKKETKKVKRLIKKNKKVVIKLADELYKNSRLKKSEMLKIFESSEIKY